MGNAESSQSPGFAAIGGFNDQSSFRRQSPNIARLIRGENSQKMEYEFPLSESQTNSFRTTHFRSDTAVILPSAHHRSIGESNLNNNNTSSSRHTTSSHPRENLCIDHKLPSNESSSLWFSLTSCFGCRTRDVTNSTSNSLRDKVHTIRIVRASNDLTPAVFDSHYNIITLEQLRECESNGSDLIETSNNPYVDSTNPQENGSINNETKSNGSRRLKRKKKKRNSPSSTARGMTSDDDEQETERT